jgi:hypothetical protein
LIPTKTFSNHLYHYFTLILKKNKKRIKIQ